MMSISNFLSTQKISMSDNDKNFLKEFSRNFHQKIIDINDFYIFENTLIEWIKNIDKNTKTILELMQCNKIWFTSVIGFFYKYIILENSLSDFVIKCLKSARKGDSRAQYEAGNFYYNGQGVTQDYNK